MKICLIDCQETQENTISGPMARYFIRQGIFCTLYYNKDFVDINHQYDFILVFGLIRGLQNVAFQNLYRAQKNAKVGVVISNHTEGANLGILSVASFLITNHDWYPWQRGKDQCILNVNSLLAKTPSLDRVKKYHAVYYGNYRPGREFYFKKYFNNPELIVSGSGYDISKFRCIGKVCKLTPRLKWKKGVETLGLFRASLYLQDEGYNYHFLSRRFYEALNCKVVSFFDSSCRATVKRSHYPIKDFYIVDSSGELLSKALQIPNDQTIKDLKIFQDMALQEKDATLKDIYKFLNRIYNGKERRSDEIPA